MNTDKINKEWARCKELLQNNDHDSLMPEQKTWWLIGVTYIMHRFSELAEEMPEEDVDDYYDHLGMEAAYELIKLQENEE